MAVKPKIVLPEPGINTMKIGILIKDFNLLENWEMRILDTIRKDPSLELSLLIRDGRKKAGESTGVRLKKLMRSGNVAGKILFKAQTVVESKIFKSQYTVNKQEIITWLSTIKSIEVIPEQKGFLDIFSKADAEMVKAYNLDIILRHEFNIIRGEILDASVHGIWSFHHGDNSINRGSPAGFWEVYLNQPVVGVTLQKLTAELDGGLVIDRGYFNRHWAFYKTNRNIHEDSVSILFKSINRLQQGKLTLSKSPVYYNPLYKVPSLGITLLYILRFYKNLVTKMLGSLLSKFFGVRHDCWTLFIGKGNYIESTLFKLKPQSLPGNEFWADPFLFRHNNEVYVFFEVYDYKAAKGKISCGKLVDNKITGVVDVLDLKTHLSYPFIFSEGNDIFMIPENSGSLRLEVYKCVEFPAKWELYSTAFEGEELIDTTYFIDDSGQRWLFLNKGLDKKYSELHIYKIDSLKLNTIENHSLNPVIIDSRIARNGGAIFRQNGNIYRPSQCSINGIYGYGLNLNIIKKLTIDEYEEEKIITVEPNFKKGLIATHHVHQLENIFVIDACYKRM